MLRVAVRRMASRAGIANDDLARIVAKAVARIVVKDWEGVGDEDGKPLPLTPEGSFSELSRKRAGAARDTRTTSGDGGGEEPAA